MRAFFVSISLFLLFLSQAWAERGLDLLGLAKLNAPVIAREMDPGAIGLLDNTFGDPRPNLIRLIQSGKVTSVRVHLGDGTPSNHQCRGNELSLSFMAAQAKKWAAFSAQYPNIKWYASPWLEHGCNNPALVNGWFAQIKANWPQATLVCSRIPQGWCPANVLKEIHGGGRGDVSSNDGSSLFDADSFSYLSSGSTLTLGWINCMNGRVTGEHPGDVVPAPMQRQNFCTTNEIRQAVRVMRDPQPKPQMNCQDFTPPRISKVNAEFYGVGHDDGRGNKPMLIIPERMGQWAIQSPQGKTVGCFKYYGPYIDGKQSRYYEGNCSGKTPDQLMDLMGSEWGRVVASSRCYNWNAIRRLGTAR